MVIKMSRETPFPDLLLGARTSRVTGYMMTFDPNGKMRTLNTHQGNSLTH